LRAWFTWIQALGEVHVIVSNEATTLENVGQFGKFSKTGDFFNAAFKVFLIFGGKDPETERLSRYDEIIE